MSSSLVANFVEYEELYVFIEFDTKQKDMNLFC